jgi:hypothetical protein
VTVEPKTLAAGLRPYQIDTVGPRRFAVVGQHRRRRQGHRHHQPDRSRPEAFPRVVDVVAVGLTPEGLKMSPDGHYVAVNVNDGSNADQVAALRPQGLVQVWRIDEPASW